MCCSFAYERHLSQQRRRCQRKWACRLPLYLDSLPPSHEGDRQKGWKRPLLMLTVLLVILILALLGALPTWPCSHAWGYYPIADNREAAFRPAPPPALSAGTLAGSKHRLSERQVGAVPAAASANPPSPGLIFGLQRRSLRHPVGNRSCSGLRRAANAAPCVRMRRPTYNN